MRLVEKNKYYELTEVTIKDYREEIESLKLQLVELRRIEREYQSSKDEVEYLKLQITELRRADRDQGSNDEVEYLKLQIIELRRIET